MGTGGSSAELDSILVTVENPIRRRILRRLSEEPGYQLQLSRELGLSQQLVAKHLDSMEDVGLVTSMLEASPRGPKRKEYLLQKSVSITIDFAPNLFRAKVFSFGGAADKEEGSDSASLAAKLSDVIRSPDEASKIGPLAQVMAEVDRKLTKIEDERAVLLYLRSLAFKEAAKASGALRRGDRKKMLQYLLREQSEGVDTMSESLGLQAQIVGDILSEIERDFSFRE
ncbi:MAG: helix-turn-helix domain-containing protein [Thaumarchaeota archaeon]|nr:helix-turn-helix domain-containing protein [Nitrososphaerota archaeon]